MVFLFDNSTKKKCPMKTWGTSIYKKWGVTPSPLLLFYQSQQETLNAMINYSLINLAFAVPKSVVTFIKYVPVFKFVTSMLALFSGLVTTIVPFVLKCCIYSIPSLLFQLWFQDAKHLSQDLDKLWNIFQTQNLECLML